MKETGLMFKAPLVRAILEGRKTQTRRIVKPQPVAGQGMVNAGYCGDRHLWLRDGPCDKTDPAYEWRCPMGKPGDRIYVRETWQIAGGNTGIWYAATDSQADDGNSPVSRWSPSIHMPKSAARIWLEITSVRVERLQDLSNEDAIAEGVNRISHGREGYYYSAIRDEQHPKNWNYPDDAFRELWDSTTGRPALPANKNSKRYARVKHWLDTHPDTTGWAANPWVWVIDFKTISTTGRPA
ncbi:MULTISPECIES: hypothetical protein [Comamonas]|uniref:hypothetical protein n=1 Tax=Comamonas TaxID=283 RepID=UPI00237D5CA7|nr:hypothetical protein [Comamonas aquatica]MDE1556324.1 hypothetical protein [Comamonas aquatica]